MLHLVGWLKCMIRKSGCYFWNSLFTLDGKLVEFPEDIKTDSHYVAAANSTGFKQIDYGNITKPTFHTFLKPLNRWDGFKCAFFKSNFSG